MVGPFFIQRIAGNGDFFITNPVLRYAILHFCVIYLNNQNIRQVAPMPNTMIIPKRVFKCMIHLDARSENVKVTGSRYVDVGNNETMDLNARLAKHEYLQINNAYINCNKLSKHILECVNKYISEEVQKAEGKVVVEVRSYLKETHARFH